MTVLDLPLECERAVEVAELESGERPNVEEVQMCAIRPAAGIDQRLRLPEAGVGSGRGVDHREPPAPGLTLESPQFRRRRRHRRGRLGGLLESLGGQSHALRGGLQYGALERIAG